MELKKIFPFTSGTRHQINLKKNLLAKDNKVIKNLLKNHALKHGRSSTTGHITVRHKGGACKKKLHVLNRFETYYGISLFSMYSSSQNAFISLNFDFLKKCFFKTISTKNTFPGSLMISNKSLENHHIGYRMQLKFLPVGSIIHSIGSNNNIIFGIAAGTFCQLIEKRTLCKVRLPSGKIKSIPDEYFATLGSVSNFKHKSTCVGKAGRNRLKGIRPSVRGIAMNPVDHPHGGRTNGGMPSVTPWGIPTKGKPTVKNKL